MKYSLQQHGLGWRAKLFEAFHRGIKSGDVYQFGVWDGFSMQVLGELTQHLQSNQYNRFFGFDVFTGMPTESNEPDKQRDEPGKFNLLKHYSVLEIEDALKLLHFDISSNLSGNTQLVLIPELVEQTLTKELISKHNLKQAFYVDMDMDIYTPTRYVLDFMVENKLIVEGTILGFDDWGQCFPEHDIYKFGESRAFEEVSEKYNIQVSQICETENHGQAAFFVTKITT